MKTQLEIYMKMRQQIAFYLRIYRVTQIVTPTIAFTIPYMWVVYKWFVGDYTIASWFYMHKIW